MKLHTTRWGIEDSEEKIVLLHGLGGTGALWRPLAASLEEIFALLAPDQRGHGKSIPSIPSGENGQDFSPLTFGKDIADTLVANHFFPAWVVGHSMGVRSACALAHLAPQYISGLVLIDLGLTDAASAPLHRELHSFLKLLPETFPSREEARRFMNQYIPDPAMGQYLMAVSVRGEDGLVRFPFDRLALLKILEDARDTDLRPWIREFAGNGNPVLLLRGERSPVWTKEAFDRDRQALADLESVKFLEVGGTGHGLPFEKRQEFTQILLTELRYHRQRPG